MLDAMAATGIGGQWDNWLLSGDRELGVQALPEHQKPQLSKSLAFPRQFPRCGSASSTQNSVAC